MNPRTHFKKTKILRNIFLSLGAIFALVTAAHAQNLYVSAQRPSTDRTQSSSSRHLGRGALTLRGCCSLEGWPLTASAIYSPQETVEADNHRDWESAEIQPA